MQGLPSIEESYFIPETQMITEEKLPEEIIPLLKRASLFSSLDNGELAEISSLCSMNTYSSNERVFAQGDSGKHCYIVSRGSVEIIKEEESSIIGDPPNQILIAQLVSGDSFGEMELFTGADHSANARVPEGEEAELLVFPSAETCLQDCYESHSAIAAKLLISYLKSTAGRLRQANDIIKENSPLVQELKKQVYGDKLTGLFNKTYLEEELPALLKRFSQTALIMFKPDNFKDINDTYGHEAGDQVIVLMASQLKKMFGEDTIIVRYMGNEHGVVLPGADKKQAYTVADDIRKAMNTMDISASTNNEPFTLTISCGIAVHPSQAGDSETLIELAHELPLVGRARGGNQILFPEDK